ncbi:uncharacterized protein METZ01_LOCUS453798, partial [marine metagenome]
MPEKIVMPKLGMVMSEGVISKFLKNKGDKVVSGNVLAQIETEKINYDLEATASGIFHPVVDIGQAVEVNGLIGYILVEGEQVPSQEESLSGLGSIKPKSQLLGKSKNQTEKSDGSAKVVKSTPGARRLAMKLHVGLAQVEATGPGGRITEYDVKKAASSDGSDNANFPALLKDADKVEELTGMRKSIASHMKNSLSSTAQLSFFLELDVTDVQAARKSFSSENDVSITMAHIL